MYPFSSSHLRIAFSFMCFVLHGISLYGTDEGQKELLDNLIYQSQLAYEQGDYKSSIVAAQDAFSWAEANGEQSDMGIALQMEALALLAQPKRQKSNRKKAIEKLEASLLVLNTTSDRSIRIKSLSVLAELATQSRMLEDSRYYTKQINLLENVELTSDNLAHALTNLARQRRLLIEKDTLISQAELRTQLLISFQKHKVDSLKYHLAKDSLILAQTELRYQEQTATLDLQRSQKRFYLAVTVLLGILGAGLFSRYKDTKKNNEVLALKNEIIESERKKSDDLLLNILPQAVALELKIKGVASARKYEQATVFFSDFANFTSISERMSPEQLVDMLDDYFKMFDSIISRYKLEKIKTIGDAYMCVGGLPDEHLGHPVDMIKAALEIQKRLGEMREQNKIEGLPFFEARIGIHTGPVVSGVVGNKKFAFDIWGDTVNVASRMEQNGSVGKVNISASTHKLVSGHFKFSSRGKLPVKNKGEIEMFFVDQQ